MLLVINVGNTNILIGAYENKKLVNSWRINTFRDKTADEFGMFFQSIFGNEVMNFDKFEAIIISTVVPNIMYSLEHSIRKYFKKEPIIVGPGIKTGINIKYENPRELGTDRLVNAVAAYELYDGPVIVIDFGTATTYNAISSKGEFLGGAISPGAKIAAEALYQRTARLPKIELVKTERVICKTTASGMQAGIFHGYVGQVNYIVQCMKEEMGEENIKVIATGGLARFIAAETDCVDEINPDLTLEGLRILYEKNS